MDCGSGLLLLLTRTIRRIEVGQVLLVHTAEPSVPPDLLDWARLAGHSIAGDVKVGPRSWQVSVVRGGAAVSVFTDGPETPVGQRLWLYSNFHCNLSCGYCCAESSPKAAPRLMGVQLAERATAEFTALGGREVMITGGEPFLHPEIGDLVGAVAQHLPVTLLTNAMVMDRGRRREAIERMDRTRVSLQVSLDSAEPALHDSQRGQGSHAKALAGVAFARQLGFTVKIAATLYDDDAGTARALHDLLDRLDIAPEHRLVRPVAAQGFAEQGQSVGLDTLAPEPTLTADGVWWHPVAVTDPSMRVADDPLPLHTALAVVRDLLAVQDAAHQEGRRHVFRCA